MKIRTGFVSNSSSSSFVVKTNETFNSPLDVAYHMLMERHWVSDSDALARLSDLIKDGRITRDTNLFFRSTNYDTYIYYRPDKTIGIYTCNNTDWDFPPEVDSPGDEFCGYEESHGTPFTSIESGLTGYRASDTLAKEVRECIPTSNTLSIFTCPDCYDEMWYDSTSTAGTGQIFCPSCGQLYYIKTPEGKWKTV